MPRTLGFLYGHYDSRGGATFVPASTKAEADAIYASIFMHHNGIFDDPAEAFEADKQVIEEDFLGFCIVQSPAPLVDGEDLEYRDDNLKLWVREYKDSTGEPAYELILNIVQPQGEHSEQFAESELGEDAFGVIVQTKELEYDKETK